MQFCHLLYSGLVHSSNYVTPSLVNLPSHRPCCHLQPNSAFLSSLASDIFVLFLYKVSLCSTDWPRTHYVDSRLTSNSQQSSWPHLPSSWSQFCSSLQPPCSFWTLQHVPQGALWQAQIFKPRLKAPFPGSPTHTRSSFQTASPPPGLSALARALLSIMLHHLFLFSLVLVRFFETGFFV